MRLILPILLLCLFQIPAASSESAPAAVELKDFRVGLVQGNVGHKFKLWKGYSPTYNMSIQVFDQFSALTDADGNVRFVADIDFDDDTSLYNAKFYASANVFREDGGWTGTGKYKWETFGTDHHTSRLIVSPDDTGFTDGERRGYQVWLRGHVMVYRPLKGWAVGDSWSDLGDVEVIGNVHDPFQQVVTILNPEPGDVYEIGTLGQVSGLVETEDGHPVDGTLVAVGVFPASATQWAEIVTTHVDGSFEMDYMFSSINEGSMKVYASDDPKDPGIYTAGGRVEVEIDAVHVGASTVGLVVVSPGYVEPGETAEFDVGVIPLAGYVGPVELAVVGLDAVSGVGWAFDDPILTLPPPEGYDGEQTLLSITTDSSTPVDSIPFTIVATPASLPQVQRESILMMGFTGTCYDGDFCLELTEADCIAHGLIYDGDGTTCPPPIGVAAPRGDLGYRLHAATPNPFNPGTTIRFDLPRAGWVELAIYDVSGRRVQTLMQEPRGAGSHEVIWRGLDESGRQLASGVYLYRLQAGSYVEARRMTLLK